MPQEKEVFAKYGAWENWGIDRTNTLMNKIKNDDSKKITIFDIHTKPKNIEDACKNFDIENYHIILLDCSDAERESRLIARGQPELINETLPTWANFLRTECKKKGYTIINNTNYSCEEGFNLVEKEIKKITNSW